MGESLPAVSAIIVSYRTGPVLWRCLDVALTDPEITEVLLVDNGNDAVTRQRLREKAAVETRLKLLGEHGNIGFAAGCNLGARAASGDALLFLNPDALLAPGSVRAMVVAAASAPHPCIVGGVLRDEAGREQRGARRGRVTLDSAFGAFVGAAPARVDRRGEPMPTEAMPMPVVSGALMYLPRADFDALGGFDEGYFVHVEDIDICRRAEALGGGAVFAPGASVTHIGATSDTPAVRVAWNKAKGFQRYFRKFARGGVERIAAEVAGLALLVLLPLGAFAARGFARLR